MIVAPDFSPSSGSGRYARGGYVPSQRATNRSEGGQNEGGSHYIDENKGSQELVLGRSHYIDENKSTYDPITHYLYEKKAVTGHRRRRAEVKP